MIFHQIFYYKFDDAPQVSFRSGDHYLLLLNRSRVLCTMTASPPCEGSGMIVFLHPGETVHIERLEEFYSYDLLEFSPEGKEFALIQSLVLPTEPYCPSYFFVICSLIKNIHYTYYSADKYRMQKISAHMKLLFYGIASGNEDTAGLTGSQLLLHRLRRLRVMISDNPIRDWTIEEAADFMGLSVSRFCVVYKKTFGTSFISDVIRTRIHHSCTMLISTDKSIAEISRESGYAGEPLYRRQFKQQIGVTPSEYRKLHNRDT